MTYLYDIHGVLTVESSVPLLDGVFHRYFLVDDDSVFTGPVDILLDVREDIDVPPVPYNFTECTAGIYGCDEAGVLYYMGASGRGSLSGLREGTITVRAETKDCIPGGLWDLFEVAVDLIMLRRGFTTIHAASLCRGGRGIVLSGFPKVGKTLATLSLLGRGYHYLGDDNSYVGQGRVNCFPSPMNLDYDDFLKHVSPSDIGWQKYLWQFFRVLPTRSRLLNRVISTPKTYLPDLEATGQRDSATADVVCCLELGPRTVRRIDTESAVRKVQTATAYSRPRLWQNPLIHTYSYFNELDIETLREREREILRETLDDAECFVVACQDRDWDAVLNRVEDKSSTL